jgi:nucleoside-diphosphate-sugar epimerase
MSVTVLGASGYIGHALVQHLRASAEDYWVAPRDKAGLFSRPLGHVIYCAGVTSDFAERPFDTVDAHVVLLRDLLRSATFDSLLYLSSTRVYLGATSTHEDAKLQLFPGDRDSLYSLSKLLGESLCYYSERPCRIVRLSNIYGVERPATTFLPLIIGQALRSRRIVLETSLDSAKDYFPLDLLPNLLLRIARQGRHKVYNLASGANTSHRAIVGAIAAAVPCQVEVRPDAPTVVFPRIEVDRLRSEFGLPSRRLIDDMTSLIAGYREVVR